MAKKHYFQTSHILTIVIIILISITTHSIRSVQSFSQIAEYHCKNHPIQLIYRLSSGQLSQKYGKQFSQIDCYIRQFVNKDGQDPFQYEEDQNQNQKQQQEQLPQIDPIAQQYSKGLTCLPQSVDKIQAVYSIWRFYRFVLQHDYAYQWMRAKIRASLGYTAEKPSSWMDGEQSAARLRLDKLFSNQFYDYVDKLMFKDFLHPLMTFLKRNTVFAASGSITKSGNPILVQIIESKNLLQKIFDPIVFKSKNGNIFAYTIPGIPLFLSGSNSKISWAFTGVLIDRSNIQQIQTLGNKFYHHDSEMWIKLQNVTFEIKVKQSEPYICKFVHSNYGTLYQKHRSDGGKISEYIARWHQNQKKVRLIFTNLFQLIQNNGNMNSPLQFPFSSLVITNQTGIFQYLCPQKHPSYFLYPDLTSAPEPLQTRWISGFKRNFLVVHNTHLTTHKQQNYIKKQMLNPLQQQLTIDIRRKIGNNDIKNRFTLKQLIDFVGDVDTDPLIKKRKQHLIYIYRKAKFLFFPEQNIRKQCDQIVAVLQKWDNHLTNPSYSPAFILWDYFFRQYTFNYVSSSQVGKAIAKHKALTQNYWTTQMQNWKAGVSYGQCDSDQWDRDYRQKLNGTGQNSTCFFNIMRGINRTRQILRQIPDGLRQPKLQYFSKTKIKDIVEGYLGSHVEQAFQHFYSRNLYFGSELNNNQIIYRQGFEEEEYTINLDKVVNEQIQQQKSDKKQDNSQIKQQIIIQQTQL